MFSFRAVVRHLCPPSSHWGGCRSSGTELQMQPSPQAVDSQPDWKGRPAPRGMLQQRIFCSPGGWARQAVWHCGSADLPGMKSPQRSHSTHIQVTDMHVRRLAFRLHAVSRPVCDVSSAQWDFTRDFPCNQPKLSLSWEEFTLSFTHLQGSQESCSLFQPTRLGRCVYNKDAPPVVVFPLRQGRWNCLPGIYH